MHKVELLVDAKDFDMVKAVVGAGCDSVFIQNASDNFSNDELKQMVNYVHENNKKIYIGLSKIPHEKDILENKDRLSIMEKLGVDAVVINEPGMVTMIKKIAPNLQIHLGEEANITNYETAKFWYNEGIKRVVVAKELSTEEIGYIRRETTLDLDIEVLVHGSMQISHSGRNLLSNFISNKSLNTKHIDNENKTYSLVEEKRPGLFFPIMEDERGTFLYSTEDLCMLEYLPELVRAGVNSFKIDSNFRDIEYMSKVVKVYSDAIKKIDEDVQNYNFKNEDLKEILNSSDRNYSTAFYLDNQKTEEEN